jgi:hypothetical protein
MKIPKKIVWNGGEIGGNEPNELILAYISGAVRTG